MSLRQAGPMVSQAPCIMATFTNQTGILHQDTNHGGIAPVGVDWLPSLIIVQPRVAGADLVTFKDAKGNAFTHLGGTSQADVLPYAAAEITGAAAGRAITVCWKASITGK